MTPKLYVDNAIRNTLDESSFLRLDHEEKTKLDEQDSIFLIFTSTSPKTILEKRTKNYVDYKFDDPSITKNNAHVDSNDENLDNVRFVKVNSMPAGGEHLTAKYYVDDAIFYSLGESSLFRLGPGRKLKLDEQDSVFLNSALTSPKTIIELPTKSNVESLHEIKRNRRDLSSVFNDQDIEFDKNKLTKLDSVTVNRNPISDIEFSTEKYIDDSIEEGTLLRFVQTLENYPKVSAGNGTYNLTKYKKIQIIDTTETKFPNIGSDLLQKWNIKCNNKNNDSKVGNFIKSKKSNSPKGHSGATSLPPIGNSFVYIETSSINHGHERVFVSFERTDIIRILNITFYYTRFSILSKEAKKSMGRLRNQLILEDIEDNTWSTRNNIHKNDQYTDSSTGWTLVNLNFTAENYGIKLI